MTGRTKSMIAAALTVPLVAFVAGVLATPDTPAPDRSRPVIIGHVDDGGDDADDDADETRDDRTALRDRRRTDRPADRPVGRSDDDTEDTAGTDDGPRPQGPATVITPAPRQLDDDGVGDDDDDDDDTDDDGSGDD